MAIIFVETLKSTDFSPFENYIIMPVETIPVACPKLLIQNNLQSNQCSVLKLHMHAAMDTSYYKLIMHMA